MLTMFGSVAVAIMFLAYWLEPRSRWYVLAFAGASAATSAYSGLVEAYPITVIEALWALVALRRFMIRSRAELLASRAGA
ncbi:MAG: hypothetical protein O2821_09300 [Chloroflexi bacterium]|nr:hypothetical protein [Chloroflexota bacterium]MDA1228863.1 hypothetical protein [Chloroflexota bacterium]